MLAAGATSVLGSLAGAIALTRGERRSWLAALGLAVDLPVLLIALYVVAVSLFNNG